MRVLFGCIGKVPETSVDYAEDDIVSIENYLGKVAEQIWSNKTTMRVVSLLFLILAIVQLIYSQTLTQYVE